MRAQFLDERFQTPPLTDHLCRFAQLSQALVQRAVRRDGDDTARAGPRMQVGAGSARIIIASGAKPGLQETRLGRAGQVVFAVRTEIWPVQPKTGRNLIDQVNIRT